MAHWIYTLIYGKKDIEISELKVKIENLKKQIEQNQIQKVKEEYYNNKYPKIDISYSRTDKFTTNQIDVRQFLNKNNFKLPIVVDLNNEKITDDEKALECLKWVINNIIYTPDITDYKQGEYWAFGYETLNSKKGDCEDGAILLYDILRYNNIPTWKIRVSAGFAINPNTNKKEGHAYVTYYCEEKDYWVVLDWCYFPNKLPISSRIEYKEDKTYGDVWFSFNEDYSWSTGLNTASKQLLNITKTKENKRK